MISAYEARALVPEGGLNATFREAILNFVDSKIRACAGSGQTSVVLTGKEFIRAFGNWTKEVETMLASTLGALGYKTEVGKDFIVRW